jgi:hypothetical protein
MRLGKTLRDNRRKSLEDKGILIHSADYFEMIYTKYDNVLTIVFMAPDEKKAKVKAKSVLHTHNGSKIISIRRLDPKRLGPDITWNRSGEKHARFQKGFRKLRVRVKE